MGEKGLGVKVNREERVVKEESTLEGFGRVKKGHM